MEHSRVKSLRWCRGCPTDLFEELKQNIIKPHVSATGGAANAVRAGRQHDTECFYTYNHGDVARERETEHLHQLTCDKPTTNTWPKFERYW